MKLTQRELLDIARELGLTRVSRLNKEALLARVWEALDLGQQPAASARADDRRVAGAAHAGARTRQPGPAASRRPPAGPETPTAPCSATPSRCPRPPACRDTAPGAAHKFDVGEGAERDPGRRLRAEAQRHIPWGYGRDRVTAHAGRSRTACASTGRSPTTASSAPAPGWGQAARAPGCRLRVYDVTGRIFDGTNAHSYFDHNAGAATTASGSSTSASRPRRPSSRSGMKSHEGYFVKIARSGRIEFPRGEPVGWGEPEWLTVQVSSGAIEGEGRARAARLVAGRARARPGRAPTAIPGPHGGGDWHQVGRGRRAGRRAPAHLGGAGRTAGTSRRSWEERTEWEECGSSGSSTSEVMRTLSWEGQTRDHVLGGRAVRLPGGAAGH